MKQSEKMKRPAAKTIRTSLTIWFLILAILPLFTGILITYIQQEKALERENFDKLIAIRDLKVQQVESWLNERIGDLKTTSHDSEIVALEEVFDNGKMDQNALDMYKHVRDILYRYQHNYNVYEEIFIINAKTGVIELSTDHQSEGIDKSEDAYFTTPMRTGEMFIKDIYYSTSIEKNTMAFSIPIFCLHEPKHIIGVLVMRVDLKNSLYALLLNKVGLGETGETLIINKDAVALNELRWYEDAPLHLTIDALPAVDASKGKTGIMQAVDYRGVDVLAAYTHIPQTGWGFIAKQDLSELNAPIMDLLRYYIILLVLSLGIVLLVVYFVSKRISDPIVSMSKTAYRIKNGDLMMRNDIHSGDELETLADAINEMADSIEARLFIQEGVGSISDVMVGQASLQTFSYDLLKQLIATTDANMGTFYVLNELHMEFEHSVSIGVDEEMLKPFSAESPEGEFWRAVAEKKIIHLKDIPEDTVFTFQTIAGDIVPKEIITIPLMVDSRVVALISLISIRQFSLRCLDILQQSWMNINSSYSSLMANEKTKTLAERLTMINQQLEAQAEELQEQSEELQNQTEELRYNAEELQQQNAELERQRRRVEEANRLKSEFLSNMSHELRTPLNSIMALSRVLIMQASDKLTEEENNYLRIVERNGKQLLSLINDILDLSKIEAGRIEMHPHSSSLQTLLNTIKESLLPIVREKNLEFRLNIADDVPPIETDDAKLHQVLQNVIGNAVKFTDEGYVEISVDFDSDKVSIVIEDTGIGISQQALPHIFEEFRQADGSSSRRYEGTGLGLAIAHKMIHNLNGNIRVTSELGKGTIFTITLPIRWQGEIGEFDVPTFSPDTYHHEEKAILIVDDDSKYVEAISKDLEEAGYRTIRTTSGKEALKLVESQRPFAIILDVIMPEIDGWEVLQRLKNNKDTEDIPVIIVSISNDEDTAFALGAVGYIQKPASKQQLIAEIHKLYKNPDSVMIVDNDEFDRRQLSEIVTSANIHTIVAHDGKECIRLLQNYIPDVLILDLFMPEMNGFQVLDTIRSSEVTRDLPVVIVTAKDLTKEERKQLEGKASSILMKKDSLSRDLFEEIHRILLELHQSPKRVDAEGNEVRSRILIVEDNEVTVIQIKKVLEHENYIVDVAPGGKQALDYVKHTRPDGIILDLMMPEVDGFKVLEKIRGTEETKKIPVLILTAKDLTHEDLSRLSNNNIQQLIQKGDVDIEGLLFKVRLMLGNEPKYDMRPASIQKTEVKHGSYEKRGRSETKRGSGIPRVLVVEDNPDNMVTVKAIIKRSCSVIEACDGEQGLARALEELPDIILLDVSLPKMDGIEVVKALKGHVKTSSIPVIAVTARAMKEDREIYLAAGFDDYVTKPIDHELLLGVLKKWL